MIRLQSTRKHLGSLLELQVSRPGTWRFCDIRVKTLRFPFFFLFFLPSLLSFFQAPGIRWMWQKHWETLILRSNLENQFKTYLNLKEPLFTLATCCAFWVLEVSPGLGVIYRAKQKVEGRRLTSLYSLRGLCFMWCRLSVDKSTRNFTAWLTRRIALSSAVTVGERCQKRLMYSVLRLSVIILHGFKILFSTCNLCKFKFSAI